MVSRHFLVSSAVTAIVVGLFAVFVYKQSCFQLSEEYKLIPEGFVLPKGCEIRIDMQTGETFAKVAKKTDKKKKVSDSLVFSKEEEKDEKKTKEEGNNFQKQVNSGSGAPEYKNITKNRIQSRLSVEMQTKLESALKTLKDDFGSWDFLEEEAAAIEFGLAILESKNFEILREFLGNGNEKALQIISICLQNNPLAVEKFVELEIHFKELKNLLEKENLSKNVFKKVLRILESFKIHGNDEKFIETVVESVKRHLKEHEQNLTERYIEIAESLF